MIALEDSLIVDIETDDSVLVAVGVSGATEEDEAVTYRGDAVPEWVWLALEGPVWIVEQTLYDADWLIKHGHNVTNVVDIRALAHHDDENLPHDLEYMAFKYCGIVMDKRIDSQGRFRCDDGTKVRVKDAPWDQLSRYLKGDVNATRAVYRVLRKKLGYEEVERTTVFTNVLLHMQERGLPYDEKRANALGETYREQLEEMDRILKQDASLPEAFNFNSGDQLAQYLYLKEFQLEKQRIRVGEPLPEGFVVDKEAKTWVHGHYELKGLNLPVKAWTENEKPKTDWKTLAVHYGHNEWIKSYLVAAKFRTALEWLDGLSEHVSGGRVYGQYNQAGTVTGRRSSSRPNLQNISRRGEIGGEIRSLFRGDLVVADFSQLEPRISAHYSQDPFLLDVYRTGKDIYRELGAYVWGVPPEDILTWQREGSKILVLSIQYGAQARKTAESLSVAGLYTTQKQAGAYLKRIEETMAGFFAWKEEHIRAAYRNRCVVTIGGRVRHLAADMKYGQSWRVERQAVNSLIQGSAADIAEGTMVWADVNIPELAMIAEVHDELLFEVQEWNDDVLARLKYAGEQAHGYQLSVPLVFEPKRVRSWAEK